MTPAKEMALFTVGLVPLAVVVASMIVTKRLRALQLLTLGSGLAGVLAVIMVLVEMGWSQAFNLAAVYREVRRGDGLAFGLFLQGVTLFIAVVVYFAGLREDRSRDAKGGR